MITHLSNIMHYFAQIYMTHSHSQQNFHITICHPRLLEEIRTI